MGRSRRATAALVAAALIVVVGLGVAAALVLGRDGGQEQDVVLDGRWQMTHAVADDLDVGFAGGEGTPTLVFHLGEQALSGCEVIGWETTVDGSEVHFGDLDVGHMMTCPPGRQPDPLDGHYADLLATVDHAERSDDRLVLTGPGLELTFAPLPVHRYHGR
ncbi:hypothetical protein H5V45_02255 [Nocardioides sp. KIGAM211]|uniref:DUF306 domain-containing protein n=1 Tax=Nocardioides luti TaxID=2761101 RepID=A0A7X0RD67_9ACTN|nr:hypothetical protein [Nocardioides luti]MBB6626133.1 hypothetical protein [Nocardioides luti]